MNNHNFQLNVIDTDSISFCKAEQTPFTKEEKDHLLNEINELMGGGINWEDDGSYDRVLVLKSKNYVLDKDGKIKYKGSALTNQKVEPALKEMLYKIIDVILNEEPIQKQITIYHQYIKEAYNIKDIARWAVKKTITENVLNGTRLNEQKVVDALQGEQVQQGDKIWVYPAIDGDIQIVAKGVPQVYKDGTPKMKTNTILKQTKFYNGDANVEHLMKRIFQTSQILKNVLDKDAFVNYNLKRNHPLLKEVVNGN